MGKIELSVLVPSVHTRRSTHLPNIVNRLYGMYDQLSAEDQEKVEILFLVDNKKMMLGEKRNEMVRIAQGNYVVFVDDDDRVEDSYIKDLLEAMGGQPDVITFEVSVSLNGQSPKICHYSMYYQSDYNLPTTYHRLPNHICCVKRDLASKVSFPSIAYGEDAAYAKLLKPLLKTEKVINKVLYHYDFSETGTETQQKLTDRKARTRDHDETLVDIVILSKADNVAKQAMTQRTIDAFITGANGLPVRVIVVEQQKGISYKNAATYLRQEDFNYNRFMNYGATKGNARWIMFCNNDLIAEDGYLHHLLAANHPVVSPKCPIDRRQVDVLSNFAGYQNGVNLSGWCFMMDRELHRKIGGLSEEFRFWLSDDVTIEQLKSENIQPMLVPEAKVRHLGSITLLEQSQEVRDELCWGEMAKFNHLYNQNKFEDNPNYQAYLKKSICMPR